MSNPIAVMEGIDTDAARLDELEKLMGDAIELLDSAEERWLEVYDETAEFLKDEQEKEGRKSDPAEHWIVGAARRHDRVAYSNWRRAKRAVEKLDKQIGAKRAAMSGRQSQLAAMRDEARAPAPQPDWSRTRRTAA